MKRRISREGVAMRFWIREIAGWLLVLLGLYVFYICLLMVLPAPPQNPRVFSAIPVLIIGFLIFRAGIQLLKVAMAARICARMPPLPAPDDNGAVPLPGPTSSHVTRLARR